MYHLPNDVLQRLMDSEGEHILCRGRRGIEKESLRIDRLSGVISQKPHPQELGAALTHPFITTDYSEALLEFVTPALQTNDEAIKFLGQVHQFTYQHLADEALWPCSMPCGFSKHSDVPLARYGKSNVGKMKTVYRRGLGLRYGRIMQTISGVHFNYSLPTAVWPALHKLLDSKQDIIAFQSAGYFSLIRNFKRLSWLVLYLFGSSPAVCKSFFQGADTGLQDRNNNTAAGEFATSLRMSDIGYNNHAQAKLNVSVNSLEEYVAGLRRAIETPYPKYQEIGLYEGNKRLQLSTNILQIANEFYSVVRPKRVAKSGEEPTAALSARGVEYVEIRALDIDPFSAVGVNPEQLDFMECLLLYCAFASSPAISPTEQVDISVNDNNVATHGRDPNLKLQRHGDSISLTDWAHEVCEKVLEIAKLLDNTHGQKRFETAVAKQCEAISDSRKTPSARVLEALAKSDMTYNEFGITRARVLVEEFNSKDPLSAQVQTSLEEVAQQSHQAQLQVEQSDRLSFEDYLKQYFS